MKRIRILNLHLVFGILFICLPTFSWAKVRSDSLILNKVFKYKQSINKSIDGISSNVYLKYSLFTDKRNFTLLVVPTLYEIARGKRNYINESYYHITFHDSKKNDITRSLILSTIPHYRMAMPNMLSYVTPHIYNETMIENYILSPFCRTNRKYYIYRVSLMMNGNVKVMYRPRAYNTQLVRGFAIVDQSSGRVISAIIEGEYDMIRFNMELVMGTSGFKSLLPDKCSMKAAFKFLGSKIRAKYKASFNLDKSFPDSIRDCHNKDSMAEVRPEPLTTEEIALYASHDSLLHRRDTVNKERHKSNWEGKMWDKIGESLIDKIRGHFGQDNKGYYRIAPLFNPLYFGYTANKGFTYKFSLQGSYEFNNNSEISLRLKTGYTFKLKQLYFKIPIRYTYNKTKNRYVEMEFSNGNHITNSSILDQIKRESKDSINWDKMNLDYFKNLSFKVYNNYDFSNYFSLQMGLVYHRRSAVNKTAFIQNNKPSVYRSLSPMIELKYRPNGWSGPVFSLDYERGIKHIIKTESEYERWEFDFSYLKHLRSLKSISMRFGSGYYTNRGNNLYFLDFTNFRENNIPGGWSDDWSGEFESLNSNWYNASRYYIRTNTTYESPMMLLSWLPFIGRFMEIERVYASTLFVNKLHPYIECGYGFTNRLFSFGLFVANQNGHFQNICCKFGFELFSNW
jgi:hypothetical protein